MDLSIGFRRKTVFELNSFNCFEYSSAWELNNRYNIIMSLLVFYGPGYYFKIIISKVPPSEYLIECINYCVDDKLTYFTEKYNK